MTERRRSERVPMHGDIYGKVKAVLPARVIDLSRDGAQLEVPVALRPLAECDLVLPSGDGPVHLRAKVTRCRAIPHRASGDDERRLTYRAGVQFLVVDERTASYLESLIVPSGAAEQPRKGPIKIRIDSGAVRRLMDERGLK